MKRILSSLACAGAFLALCACSAPSWYPNALRPYRPDVQQGNIVTKDMVEGLRPGMTRDQVRFLLGTPMLTDIFHQDRWDYPYYLRRRSGETQTRHLSIVFADGKLDHFTSDPMPAEPLADSLILGSKSKAPTIFPADEPAPAADAPPSGTAPAPSPAPAPAPAPVPAPAPAPAPAQ